MVSSAFFVTTVKFCSGHCSLCVCYGTGIWDSLSVISHQSLEYKNKKKQTKIYRSSQSSSLQLFQFLNVYPFSQCCQGPGVEDSYVQTMLKTNLCLNSGTNSPSKLFYVFWYISSQWSPSFDVSQGYISLLISSTRSQELVLCSFSFKEMSMFLMHIDPYSP